MYNNESKLWDEKYLKSDLKSGAAFINFAENNPTVVELRKNLFKGARVLEIGCGTGSLISFLSQSENIEAYGLDFSEKSIEIARHKASLNDQKVEFFHSDICNNNFESNFFDFIFGDQVIGHIENQSQALNEIYRILKPGGYIFISTANKIRFDGWDLYKKISTKHTGYLQRSYYSWELIKIFKKHGFNFTRGYGDMLILFRNFNLLKERFKKNNTDSILKSPSNILRNNKPSRYLNFVKSAYYLLENITPWFVKISIGLVATKK